LKVYLTAAKRLGLPLEEIAELLQSFWRPVGGDQG
jgi:DNA-binding transcriptional MerR regulator